MTLTIEEIKDAFAQMERESKALRSEIFKLAWFMRGSVNLEQAYMLDAQEREIISKLVQENLNITKETQLPFF